MVIAKSRIVPGSIVHAMDGLTYAVIATRDGSIPTDIQYKGKTYTRYSGSHGAPGYGKKSTVFVQVPYYLDQQEQVA